MKKLLLLFSVVCCSIFGAVAQTKVYEIDYSKTDWNFYVMGYTPQVVDGILTSENPMDADNPEKPTWYQYFIADQIPTKIGALYTAVIKMKASEAANVNLNMGWGWNEGQQIGKNVTLPTEWTEVEVKYEGIDGTSSNLVLQPGTYMGKIEIEWVKVYQEEGDEPVTPPTGDVQVYEIDYADTPWSFYVMGYTPEVVDGILTSENPMDADDPEKPTWYQYFIADQIPTDEGETYIATVKIKASEAANVNLNMGWGWKDGEQVGKSITLPTEWTEVSTTYEGIIGDRSNLVLQPGTYMGKIEIAWVKVVRPVGAGVDEVIAPVENTRTVVYNLMGVKVLDTDDAAEVNNLAKGLYIVNGKKVAIR